jgi:2-polyprenyl-3-methyl-5-hydroxy-6-metoxy-1,4-benzoquinol methylase
MDTGLPTQSRLPGCTMCERDAGGDPPVISENGYTGYQCSRCRLIYIHPRPELSSIANLYDHDSAHVSAAQWIAASSTYGRALKARNTLKIIRRHVPRGRLLEIGAGGGAFARQAKAYYDVSAAELNPGQVEHMRSIGVDCRRGLFSDVFRGETFDVIYHCDVLSHLYDPVAEFQAMRAMLNPGGVLVFETGNNGDMDQRFYRFVQEWMYPDHLFFFSEQSLANLGRHAGFEPVETHVYSREIEHRLMKRLQGAKQRAQSGPGAERISAKRKAMLNVKHLLDYALIYVLGAWTPKRGRPQTVISVWRPAS